MKYKKFPMYIDISNKKVLIVGAGNIGARRALKLIDFTDNIYIISPSINNELKEAVEKGEISWRKKTYEIKDLEGMDIVIAATDDKLLNSTISKEARRYGKTVNNASDRNDCDFQFPGIINYEDICISFNGSGRNHSKTRMLREKIFKFLNGECNDE